MCQTLDWVLFYITFNPSGHSELLSIMSTFINKEAETLISPQRSCPRTHGLYMWSQMRPARFRDQSLLIVSHLQHHLLLLESLCGTYLLLAHCTCSPRLTYEEQEISGRSRMQICGL